MGKMTKMGKMYVHSTSLHKIQTSFYKEDMFPE